MIIVFKFQKFSTWFDIQGLFPHKHALEAVLTRDSLCEATAAVQPTHPRRIVLTERLAVELFARLP